MIPISEITEQKISEKYNGLSQDLKDILSSAETSSTIENIAVKYQLDEEKIEMLIQLVGLVILDFVTFEDMKIEMKEVLEINPQFIPLIADEIRQKIKEFPTPRPVAPPVASKVEPLIPSTDHYREPTIGPEVVDLRKTPPPPPPVVSKVEPPPVVSKVEPPPVVSKVEPPPPPVKQVPLIEAEPHKIPTPAQVILRSPGLLPTDLARDILDLRKDKGEF